MSWWLEERLGRSKGTIETISYTGAPDVRYGIILLAAIKLGYKISHDSTISGMLDIGKQKLTVVQYLVPSNRNSASGNAHLMEVTNCGNIFCSPESEEKVRDLTIKVKDLNMILIPTLEEMLAVESKHYPYEEPFDKVQDHPCPICRTSGSTVFPKPIDNTQAAMAVYDNQRLIPLIDGRSNCLYANYEGHPYYTSFPPFHLAGIVGLVTTPVFYENAYVVLPAPDVPNNGAAACEVLQRAKEE